MSDELPPIRCVTCGKVLANKWTTYQEKLSEGKSIEQALNYVGLTRPCCRLRLRNPFKVVERASQINQDEITKSFQENFDTLSYSYDSQAPTSGALSNLTESSSTIIFPEEEIELPPLPEITELPKTDQNTRVYRAW